MKNLIILVLAVSLASCSSVLYVNEPSPLPTPSYPESRPWSFTGYECECYRYNGEFYLEFKIYNANGEFIDDYTYKVDSSMYEKVLTDRTAIYTVRTTSNTLRLISVK